MRQARTAYLRGMNGLMQSVDLIAWRRLEVSSRNVLNYVASDYIVRQMIYYSFLLLKSAENNFELS